MLAIKTEKWVLDKIFVAPGAQGSGVGAALIAIAKELMPKGFSLRMAAGNRRPEVSYERAGLRMNAHGAILRPGSLSDL